MKHIFKLLLLLVITYSCEEPVEHYKLSKEAYDWAYFKPGSYWVYQNDSTGELDSVFVTNALITARSIYDSDVLKSTYEETHMSLKNSFNDSIGVICMGIWCDVTYYGSSMNGPKINFDVHILPEKTNDTSLVIKHKEYTVNNKLYYNVLQNKSETDYFGHATKLFYNNEYYIAKNFWIIKKLEYENDTLKSWSLVRSNIVQ